VRGLDRPKLDHGVVRSPGDTTRAHDQPAGVKPQIRRIEEVHLPDLSDERIQPERSDRRSLRRVRHARLQLDAICNLGQTEEIAELISAQGTRCAHADD
jgi:hypothetical protein